MVLAPLIMLAIALLLIENPSTEHFYRWLVSENQPVELLSFLALMYAGFMGLQLALIHRRAGSGPLVYGFLLVFASSLFFVGMEEISWGQWFVGFETPDQWKAINYQGEMNLHNLPVINELFEVLRMAFGIGGLLSIWLVRQRLFRLPLRREFTLLAAPEVLTSWLLIIAVLGFLDLLNVFVPPEQRPKLLHIAAQLPEMLELLIGITATLYMALKFWVLREAT